MILRVLCRKKGGEQDLLSLLLSTLLSGWLKARRQPKMQMLEILFFEKISLGRLAVHPWCGLIRGRQFCQLCEMKRRYCRHSCKGDRGLLSLQLNDHVKPLVQTIKNAIKCLAINTTVEWEQLLQSIVNAIRERKISDGYGPYKLIFGIPPIRLMAALERLLQIDLPNEGESAHHESLEARLIEVLSRRLKLVTRTKMNFSAPVCPFTVKETVLVRKPSCIVQPALKPKWMRPCKVVVIRGAHCCLQDESRKRSRRIIHVRDWSLFLAALC